MENIEEQEYVTRFNQGYLLAKHKPKLFAQITKDNEKSESLTAFMDGAKQVEREKVREELKEIHDTNSKDKEKGKEIDL